MKELLKSYFFDGLFLIALGIIMLLWPEGSMMTLCIIIGAALMIMGLLKVIGNFSAGDASPRTSGLTLGLVQAGIGAALMVAPEFFIAVFQFIAAVLLIYGAVLMFIQAYRLRKERDVMFTLSLIFASLTTLLAIIIFINPRSFALFMTQLYGISLIVEGLAMIIVLRRRLF